MAASQRNARSSSGPSTPFADQPCSSTGSSCANARRCPSSISVRTHPGHCSHGLLPNICSSVFCQRCSALRFAPTIPQSSSLMSNASGKRANIRRLSTMTGRSAAGSPGEFFKNLPCLHYYLNNGTVSSRLSGKLPNTMQMTYLPDPKRYDEAQFRRCGRSGIVLPPISLGLWQNFGGIDSFETGRAMIRRAFDRGVTHFDLANNYGPPYGSAEENFGHILSKDFRGHRNELVISSKAGWDMWPGPYGVGGSRKYLLASLDESLQRMGLEYVDIFYSHRPSLDVPLEETMGALAHAVRQGKALY